MRTRRTRVTAGEDSAIVAAISESMNSKALTFASWSSNRSMRSANRSSRDADPIRSINAWRFAWSSSRVWANEFPYKYGLSIVLGRCGLPACGWRGG